MAIQKEEQQKTKTKMSSKKQSVGLACTISERLTIPIKKYDSEVFRLLVQFIHCGTVNITEETVAGLFCGASQFEILDLKEACLDFVERCLTSGRSETLLMSTRAYSQHKSSKHLFDKVGLRTSLLKFKLLANFKLSNDQSSQKVTSFIIVLSL